MLAILCSGYTLFRTLYGDDDNNNNQQKKRSKHLKLNDRHLMTETNEAKQFTFNPPVMWMDRVFFYMSVKMFLSRTLKEREIEEDEANE